MERIRRLRLPQYSPEVRHDLLVLSLKSAGTSVPLLALAGGLEVWIAAAAGAFWIALSIAFMTAALSAWRWSLATRHGHDALAPEVISQVENEFRGNALLAGLIWALVNVGLYPVLNKAGEAELLVLLAGSAAVAMHFMTMVRGAYALLIVPSIGSLTLVSLLIDAIRSVPMAALSAIYAFTMLRSGRQYRQTAAEAIEHRLAAEAANIQLQKAKEEAEAGAVAKSQFLATMSHEIRTPMNGVLGSLEMLRHSGLNDEQRRLVRTAGTSGESLMAILNDVLDHAKIEAGKLTITPAPLSVPALAESVASLFRANAEAKGLTLKLKLSDDLPTWVVGDHQRLKQVLLNLVSNAIKFTDRGGVRLSVTRRCLTPSTVTLQFNVTDTGMGIPGDELNQLFQPFSQLRPGSGRGRRGTGLGLSISQRIVEAMGGYIHVVSEVGMGSTFCFSVNLPVYLDEPPQPLADSAPGGFDLLEPLSGTVLLVDDDAVNRVIARSHLEALGLQVVEAEDGLEALDKSQERAVDIVFMDCQMPHLDGYATAMCWREREARHRLRRTPIVALTANAHGEDIARAKAVGMDGHLAKPYTRAQLKEQLQAWL